MDFVPHQHFFQERELLARHVPFESLTPRRKTALQTPHSRRPGADILLHGSLFLLAAFMFLEIQTLHASGTNQTPELHTLLTNAIERVGKSARIDAWLFTRVRAIDELNRNGKVESTREETHFIRHRNSKAFERLQLKNGKPLSATEEKREAKKEHEFLAGKPPPEKPRDRKVEFTEDLLQRFDFVLAGPEIVNSRPAWRINFRPKSSSASFANLTQEVLGKLEGSLWIDGTDYQLSRISLNLQSSVKVLAGIIGVLESLTLNHERHRAEPGVWLPDKTDLRIVGRKLFSPVRLHIRENGKGYHKLLTIPAPSPTE